MKRLTFIILALCAIMVAHAQEAGGDVSLLTRYETNGA